MTDPYVYFLAIQEARPEIKKYATALKGAGFEEREVARAVFYVAEYGMESLEHDDVCLVFDIPTCNNWNCLNPEHQRFTV